jgi:transcriptional regulator with XRE-family HTH domain
MVHGPLEIPWTRRQLIVDLALSGKTQEVLAEKYGVTQGAISQFKAKHATEVAAVLADTENEFAGIALAEKANRLATYQDILKKALSATPKTNGKGEIVYGIPDEHGERHPIMEIDAGVAQKILRNMAEELGHLPNRVTLDGGIGIRTDYTINGVDPEALK